ncbi:hypothetical protein L6452_00593 [Arctium lappa]|uniref:Uncharacterized protein n=1 Tax=Arctium lappa TaxID=4217 RepID=A0ACB9FFA5_ARCLA|nr:hypothetical protein L6452_00593 [Arctium lappa]
MTHITSMLIVTCTESLLSHDEECFALYLFKQSIPHVYFETHGVRKFDSWKITTNASDNGSSNCCLWDGVVCSSDEEIPDEISQLRHLSSLDLSGNPLKLQSPSLEKFVQNLTGLEELDLSGVDISSSVPHFMANFSSLRSIVLYNCSLQNEFPWAILQLPKLKFLDVASNPNLNGSFPEFRNSLLEHLDLLDTSFFGIVPESIGKLHRLTFLCLTS